MNGQVLRIGPGDRCAVTIAADVATSDTVRTGTVSVGTPVDSNSGAVVADKHWISIVSNDGPSVTVVLPTDDLIEAIERTDVGPEAVWDGVEDDA